MHKDLPVCKRCCFCLPLRCGLLTWGYLRLVISMLLLIGLSKDFYRIIENAITEEYQISTVQSKIEGFLILLTVTDIVLNALFIVGGHKKNLKLLRAYYIYSFILCILTTLLGLAFCIFVFNLLKIGELDLTYNIWVVLVYTATMLAQVSAQVYALLLVRSEIIELRNHCE